MSDRLSSRWPEGCRGVGGKHWLLRDNEVLAAAEVCQTLFERTRGLLGRDGYEGAMVFFRTRSVHTMGMRFPIDVAFLDRDLQVVAITTLRPWRVALPRRGGRVVIEAQAGAFERWGLRLGDRVELCNSDPNP